MTKPLRIAARRGGVAFWEKEWLHAIRVILASCFIPCLVEVDFVR